MDCGIAKEQLVDVLYGDAAPETARQVEAHLGQCQACRDEAAGLRLVRRQLATWRAPEPRPVAPRRSYGWPVPRFLAAAAALLVAAGAALALRGVEVRYPDGQLALRVGRGAPDGEWREALAQQEARHRREIEALQVRYAREDAPARPAPADGDAVLAQVAQLIRESEARQARRIEADVASLARRTEAQRRFDMARVSAGLSYLEGRNGQHLSRTTEMIGHVLEASQKGGAR
jgi:hypothetical protein